MDVALLTDSMQIRSRAVDEVEKTCKRIKATLHFVLYDDAVRFRTTALDSMNHSDVLVVDMGEKLQEHQAELLYHLSVRESSNLLDNVILLNFVPGKSNATLVSSLKQNVTIIPYLLTKDDTLVSLDTSVLDNELLQDDTMINKSCLQRKSLSDEILDVLKASKGNSRAPVQMKFLADLRKARSEYKGAELRERLRMLRRRLDDPQLMCHDIVRNMLLAYRDCADYDGMIKLVKAIRQPDVLPNAVDTSTFTYLYAFALNRRKKPGDQELALKEITGLIETGVNCSADMYGLRGRIYKDRFVQSPDYSDTESLKLAIESYRTGYQASASDYLGINLATLLACDDPDSISGAEHREICARLNCSIGALGDISQLADYWDLATLFELCVLNRNYSGAVPILDQMFRMDPPAWKLSSTIQNIKLICHFRRITSEKSYKIPNNFNFWLEFLFDVQVETEVETQEADTTEPAAEEYQTLFLVLIMGSQDADWKPAYLDIGLDPRRLRITFCDQSEPGVLSPLHAPTAIPDENSPASRSESLVNYFDLSVENIKGISVAKNTVGQVYLFTVCDLYNYTLKFSCDVVRMKFCKVVRDQLLKPEQRDVLSLPYTTPTRLEFEYSGQKLGAGAFGTVYAGIERNGERPIAIKEIPIKDPTQEQRMVEEIRLHARLEHKNIVRYLDAVVQNNTLKILMELVSGGSLKFVVKTYGKLDEETVADYSAQILEGLYYLHKNRIVHRDIKPDNILVDKHEPLLKISDFGVSKLLMGLERRATSVLGTHCYMAPELLQNKGGYDFSVDIWSFGCTVVYMLTGQPLYGGLNEWQVCYLVGSTMQHPDIPDDVSSTCRDFLERTFAPDPEKRAPASALRLDPFVDPHGYNKPRLPRSSDNPQKVTRSTVIEAGQLPVERFQDGFVSPCVPDHKNNHLNAPLQVDPCSTSVPAYLNATAALPPPGPVSKPKQPRLNLNAACSDQSNKVPDDFFTVRSKTPEPTTCTPEPFKIIRQEAESKRLLCEALTEAKDSIVLAWHKQLTKSGARLPLSAPRTVSPPPLTENAEIALDSNNSSSPPLSQHEKMELELLECLYRMLLNHLRGGSLWSTMSRFVAQSFGSEISSSMCRIGESPEDGLTRDFCTIIKKLQLQSYRDDVALYPSSWLFTYLYSALGKLWRSAEAPLCKALRGPHAVLAWYQFIQDAVVCALDQLNVADQYINLDATKAHARTDGKRVRMRQARAERRTVQLGSRKSTTGPQLSSAESGVATQRIRPISLAGQAGVFQSPTENYHEEPVETMDNVTETNIESSLPATANEAPFLLSSAISSDVESDAGVHTILRESSTLKVKYARLVSEYNELFRIAIAQKEMDIEELRHVVPEFTCHSLEASTGFPNVRTWLESLDLNQDDLETLASNITDESDFLAMGTKEDLYRMNLHYSTILRVWRAVVSIRGTARTLEQSTV
ncbi:hypothetical protein CRM22_000818 [Opisthorchis felineus]|uniref:Protein kinase domain-containing protein n=1 Tax=Opisthorchis felineus TaxID=147828 RepID=A0A4S2MDK5_OPIFE|nr:hypothetical protein CRM22_000818 [Opisthorchis felineus]